MPADGLEALEEALDILSDPQEMAAGREGVAELDGGEGVSLEQVRREMVL